MPGCTVIIQRWPARKASSRLITQATHCLPQEWGLPSSVLSSASSRSYHVRRWRRFVRCYRRCPLCFWSWSRSVVSSSPTRWAAFLPMATSTLTPRTSPAMEGSIGWQPMRRTQNRTGTPTANTHQLQASRQSQPTRQRISMIPRITPARPLTTERPASPRRPPCYRRPPVRRVRSGIRRWAIAWGLCPPPRPPRSALRVPSGIRRWVTAWCSLRRRPRARPQRPRRPVLRALSGTCSADIVCSSCPRPREVPVLRRRVLPVRSGIQRWATACR